MMEVRRLDGVHAAKRQDAEGEEDGILRETGEAEAVVLSAVGEAKAGEEEVEGAEAGEEEMVCMVEPKREEQPRQRQSDFEDFFSCGERDEVGPENRCGYGGVWSGTRRWVGIERELLDVRRSHIKVLTFSLNSVNAE